MSPPKRPNPRAAIAAEQARVVRVATYVVVVLGVLLFGAATAMVLVDDELSIFAAVCAQVTGVAMLLAGLKKLRDLRDE